MLPTTEKQRQFLTALADLCETYEARFFYPNTEEGIHISVGADVVYVGWLDKDTVTDLREAVSPQGDSSQDE